MVKQKGAVVFCFNAVFCPVANSRFVSFAYKGPGAFKPYRSKKITCFIKNKFAFLCRFNIYLRLLGHLYKIFSIGAEKQSKVSLVLTVIQVFTVVSRKIKGILF